MAEGIFPYSQSSFVLYGKERSLAVNTTIVVFALHTTAVSFLTEIDSSECKENRYED